MESPTSVEPRSLAVALRVELNAFVTRGALWCVLLWWLPAGCLSSKSPSAEPITRLQPLLGTFVSITVYAEPIKTQTAINAAFSEFRAVDRLLSIHREDSDLAKTNNGLEISAELQPVLKQALSIARETEGAFDPTIRPLAELWGFIKKEGYRLPTDAELRNVLPLVDYRQVELKDNILIKGKAGMSIDPGGFGKGYAVDRAIAMLERHGIRNAMVKAGGDTRVIGLPPGQDHWKILIEDPRKLGRRALIKLRHGALSTSGNYENFFEIDGRHYGHLLDPRTGYPIQGIGSCTATAATCMESDAYATAASVLGVTRSQQLLGSKAGFRFVMFPEADPQGPLRVVETDRFPSSD